MLSTYRYGARQKGTIVSRSEEVEGRDWERAGSHSRRTGQGRPSPTAWPPPLHSTHLIMSLFDTFARATVLAAIPLVSLSPSAEAQPVGILGGIPGDAEDSSRFLPAADRVAIGENYSVTDFTVPLNGLRNYNFYYRDGVDDPGDLISSSSLFVQDGPWVIRYLDESGNNLPGSAEDDAGYDVIPPITRSFQPYDANPDSYTNNADVYYELRGGISSPVQHPANRSDDGYLGALGIQGVVRLDDQSPFTSPVLEEGAAVDLIRVNTSTNAETLVSALETNGGGFYSFYYTPGDVKGFIPSNPSGTKYKVVATSASGSFSASSALFDYSPDALKLDSPSSPINNEDYYVAGAKATDSGAGQPPIDINTTVSSDRLASRDTRGYLQSLAVARKELLDRARRGEYEPVHISVSSQDAGMAVSGTSAGSQEGSVAVEMFPNPTSDRLFVRVAGPVSDAPATLAVYDMLGRRVLSESVTNGRQRNVITVSSLSPGLYLLEVRTDGAVMSERFTVTR